MKIVAIDESGDPGNKIGLGSSSFFVYCFVILDETNIKKIDKILTDLSYKMYNNNEHEFHFTNETHKQRKEFLKTIKALEVSVFVFLYEKNSNKTKNIKNHVLEAGLINIKKNIKDEKVFIKIDGIATRLVKKEQATKVRKIAKSSDLKVVKIGFYDSKNNRDIQIADMIAGTVRRYYENGNKNDTELLDLIKSKVKVVVI